MHSTLSELGRGLYGLVYGVAPKRRVITVGVIERGPGGTTRSAWVVREDGRDVARFDRIEDAKRLEKQLTGQGPERAA